MKILEIIYLEI